MHFMNTSRLIGALTAAAIALTTFAAVPAHAGSERDQRNARAFATILGIAVLGKIIHDNRKEDKAVRNADRRIQKQAHRPTQKQVRRNVQRNNRQVHNDVQRNNQRVYGKSNRHVQPKPLPRRVNRKLLPQHCFRSFNTRQGQVHMFGRRCLERNFRFANRLPQHCAQRVRTNQGTRAGFDARCLRRDGYSLARG